LRHICRMSTLAIIPPVLRWPQKRAVTVALTSLPFTTDNPIVHSWLCSPFLQSTIVCNNRALGASLPFPSLPAACCARHESNQTRWSHLILRNDVHDSTNHRRRHQYRLTQDTNSTQANEHAFHPKLREARQHRDATPSGSRPVFSRHQGQRQAARDAAGGGRHR